MSNEKLLIQRSSAAERCRRYRQKMSEEQRASDLERRRRLRQNVSEEQLLEKRRSEAEKHRHLRQKMSKDKRAYEVERRRWRRQRSREQSSTSTSNIGGNCLLSNNGVHEDAILEHSCGGMTVRCEFCLSLNFSDEKPSDGKFTRCCSKGKVCPNDIHFPEYPAYLKRLMTNEDSDSKNFMENIRSINSSFAFASMGANIASPSGYGPYCFRIHGQVYHRTGTLHPSDGVSRKFAQLYILDTAEATSKRLAMPENQGCSERLMINISNLMHEINELTKSYKMLHEVEKEAQSEAAAKGIAPTEVTMAIKYDRNSDPGRYNSPRVTEVAVIFRNQDGEPPFERDLLIHCKPDPNNPSATKMKQISILFPTLDAMTYPILFPHGEKGWGTDIALRLKDNSVHNNNTRQNVRTRVTQMQYYGFHLSVRDTFNPILNAGKLTQQFIVDSYSKMEANRINFIKANQSKLRVEKYSGLMDYLKSRSENDNVPIGKMIILPSSFEGSPRNMQQRYQDAMAIVTKYGKPDLFITMTCNPKWADITNNLQRWQKVENRPDLVARVFNIKLNSLLNDVCKFQLFGKVIAKIHVIEFQKRGLPHAHILLILDSESKLRTEDDIDRIVKAEIPDEDQCPRLFQIVKSNMVHGPCGIQNPNSPCMENGKCSKGYPKEFQNVTIGNIDGYPKYKRRSGSTMSIGNKVVDNTWIVPYNPYLCLKYNCHINVEVCASIKSVKYLFKYIYKGHDCANIQISEKNIINHDEVQDFIDSRYVSAPEAVWRLFAMRMHDQSHAITRLAIHLPNDQNLYFHADDFAEVLDRAKRHNSTLMAWFLLNREDSDARNYYYWEIPQHYVFNNSLWTKRRKGGNKVLGRLFTVSFREPERYYLRLLLLHVKGAISFEDLRTVGGVTYDTFHEAAKHRGLLLDDTIWKDTIDDAIVLNMPKQLRQLFAYICVFGCPSAADKLWDENKSHFIEDFCWKLHRREGTCVNCEMHALKEIQEVFTLHGMKCSHFKLPDYPLLTNTNTCDESYERQQAEVLINSLNDEQLAAFQTITSTIEDQTVHPKCFFLDGPGGSGKTYLYKVLIHYIRGRGGTVLPTASTGIAANLLNGGRTFHSQYKLPIPLNETSISRLDIKSEVAKTIKKAQLLIIDECTMASSHAINTIDRLLREIMNLNVAFGGKVLLLGGDFRQCLSIVPHAMRSAIVQTSLKYCDVWGCFRKLSLTTNMRSEDSAYSEWLVKLGDGKLDSSFHLGMDIIEIPHEMICNGSIIEATFGNSISIDNIKNISKRAILCPKNEHVQKLNEEILDILDGDFHTYLSDDSIDSTDDAEKENFPIEFLNSITPSGMPCHKLKLKVGAIIMLLRNLNSKWGLCNGTRFLIKRLRPNIIEAEVLTGSAEGEVVLIPRIDLSPSDTGLPFKLIRRQFPVMPAFAMTINKSQGQTLDRVGIFLPEPVFAHGQLYVAFSRVRRACDVKVKVVNTLSQGKLVKHSESVFTLNVVYREILE